jgi:hypothetical protein
MDTDRLKETEPKDTGNKVSTRLETGMCIVLCYAVGTYTHTGAYLKES